MELFYVTAMAVAIAAIPSEQVPPGSGMVGWLDWSPFHHPFNFTQQPAASVPCGFTSSGLPIGLQIVGARYADALVLRAARAYESRAPFTMPSVP